MMLTTCVITWDFFRHPVDKDGNNYCGLTLYWNYPRGYVDVSIPKCIPKARTRLNYKPKLTPQDSPHKHIPITHSKNYLVK